MEVLKNKKDLLVLAFVLSLFLFLYVFVQSGRWADAFYGLGIDLLLWGVYFFQNAHRERDRVKKIQEGSWEDLKPQTLVEEALTQKIKEVERVGKEQEAKRLEEEEALSQYLLRWSHQIKIPMAALLAWLDAEGIEDQNPRLQVFKMEEYLENILSYERLQGRDTDYVFTWVSLKGILQKAIRAYAPLFIYKDLSIDLGLEDVEVLTDSKWLLFFVKQWLSNVVKYTNHGGLKIFFDQGTLVFQDSGIGIAKEDLPRVMDMGYTGYTGRDFQRSTGIGLYLMKEVAKNLNLDLTLESQIGQGTSLKVTFPRETYKMSH